MSNENTPQDECHRPAVGGPVERMVRPRSEVAALIKRQLNGPEDSQTGDVYCQETPEQRRKKGTCWHYGKQELRELLDFVYGGPPATDDERVA